MATDPFPLLQRLKVGSYENCAIVTYNADLFFFEQVVLPTLRSHGCNNNLILMDLKQYEASLLSAAHDLRSLGKSYSVWPVSATGAFHPKLIFQSGRRGGRLILGSGNLTVRGFSSNWELFSEIQRGGETDNDGLFQQVWDFVRTVSEGVIGAPERQLRQFEETSHWLLETSEPPDWPRLMVARPEGPSIVAQLRDMVGDTIVRRLIVVAPFFDARLHGIRELVETFKPRQSWLVIQPDKVSFPGKEASKLKQLFVTRFEAPQKEKAAEAYLHAKAYVIETDDGDFCLWGSPNCTSAAIVHPTNVESAILQKGRRGEFVKKLNLSSSLKKSQCFDPSSLTIREGTSDDREVACRLVGAEVQDDTIRVLLADEKFLPQTKAGRLLFWASGEAIGEVAAQRLSDGVFSAEVSLPHERGTVICRLVLSDEGTEVTSTPAAIHFLSVIAQATPSRYSADIERISAAIRSGSADWAKGLEQVCELLFKIELSGTTGDTWTTTKGVARKKADKEDSSEVAEEIKDYEYFVGTRESSRHKGTSAASLLLEDILGALTSQMLRGVQQDSDDEDSNGKDLWKYQEETESGSAESGGTDSVQVVADPDDTLRAHRKLRNGYRRLMRQLTQRYEKLRDNNGQVSAHEFWRLGAVTLLLMNGCGRELRCPESFGSVLIPEDILSEYLPAMAVMFGRVRVLASSNDSSGPLVMKTQIDATDHHILQSAATTSVILSALVEARRQWTQRPEYIRGKDDPHGWPHFTEIVAARSFAALLRLGLLPACKEFVEVAQETIRTSGWLSALGIPVLRESFRELFRRANVIIETEDKFDAQHPPTPISAVKEGAWVCAPSTGVTEVLKVSGKNVELARIGESKKEKERLVVMAKFVIPTRLTRCC